MKKVKSKILDILNSDCTKLVDEMARGQLYAISAEEHKSFEDSFKSNIKSFEYFDAIDCTGIEPLNYPIENKNFHLRNDNQVREMDKSLWLDKKDHNEEGYVEINYEK